jgi:hypothetical protein
MPRIYFQVTLSAIVRGGAGLPSETALWRDERHAERGIGAKRRLFGRIAKNAYQHNLCNST